MRNYTRVDEDLQIRNFGRKLFKSALILIVYNVIFGSSFAPLADLSKRRVTSHPRRMPVVWSEPAETSPRATKARGKSHAREMLLFLQEKYPSNCSKQESQHKASWSKTQMYLYRAQNRLTWEQVKSVLDFLDKTVPPATTMNILQTSPRILRKPVDSFLQPTADFLLTLWGPGLFQEAVSRNPTLLLAKGVGYTKRQDQGDAEIVRLLTTKAGLSSKAIQQLKQSSPFVFGLSPSKVRSVMDYLFDLLRSSDNAESSARAKLEAGNRRTLGRIVTTHPHLLNLSVEANLRPRVQYIQDACGMNATQVAKMVHSSMGTILSLSVDDNLKPTLSYLEKVLVGTDYESTTSCEETLRKCLLSHPQILTLSMSNLMAKVQYFSEIQNIGGPVNPSDSLASRILSRCPAVYSLSLPDNIIPKVGFLSNAWGLSTSNKSPGTGAGKEASLFHRLQEFPNVLTMSLEGNLRPTLNFFNRTGYTVLTEDWELVPGSTTISGRYMAASLYNRLLPRWHYCLSQGFGAPEDSPSDDDVSPVVSPARPPLHLLVQASDEKFCSGMGFDFYDFLNFKEAAIPRLKFSSQFDTWLKTGRPIQI